MDSVYLSSGLPRFPLRTEEDMLRAIETQALSESHVLDLKRQIPQGKAKNVELARDLASFAIDGGTIIVGVGEEPDGTVASYPVELSGLAERVDQVAHFGIDPPLTIVTDRIRTEVDPAFGYLVIRIPPSSEAPHAVDGRYVGRADTTKRYLSDAEVLRLHERRLARRVDGEQRVRDQFARDPFSGNQRQAHLFVIAEPIAAPEDMLVPFFDGGQWQQFGVDLLQSAIYDQKLNTRLQSGNVSPFSPDFDTLQSFDLRANGVALTSSGMTIGRKLADEVFNRETVAELEIGDSGTLHAYMSRLSDTPSNDGQQYVLDSAPVAYVFRLLAITVKVCERAGYFGPWTLGVGATGLMGTRSWLHYQRHMGDSPIYNEKEYVRTLDATYMDMRDRPGRITERLTGALLRSLRVQGVFAGAFADAEPPQ